MEERNNIRQVERRVRDMTEVVQRYGLSKHGQRLVIFVQFRRGASEPVMPEFKQVYDRYAATGAGGE